MEEKYDSKDEINIIWQIFGEGKKKLDENEKKLEEHDKKIEEHEKKLEEHEKKLEEHEKKLEELEKEIKELKMSMSFITRLSDSLQNIKNNNEENEILNEFEEIELNEQFKNEDEIRCAICLENFSIGDKICYLPCVHSFHSSCIKNWIRIKNKCPICNNIINFS